jgi:hypothetical protein
MAVEFNEKKYPFARRRFGLGTAANAQVQMLQADIGDVNGRRKIRKDELPEPVILKFRIREQGRRTMHGSETKKLVVKNFFQNFSRTISLYMFLYVAPRCGNFLASQGTKT